MSAAADNPAPVGPHHHEPGPVEVPVGEVGPLEDLYTAFYDAQLRNDAAQIRSLYRRILTHPRRVTRRLPVALDD